MAGGGVFRGHTALPPPARVTITNFRSPVSTCENWLKIRLLKALQNSLTKHTPQSTRTCNVRRVSSFPPQKVIRLPALEESPLTAPHLFWALFLANKISGLINVWFLKTTVKSCSCHAYWNIIKNFGRIVKTFINTTVFAMCGLQTELTRNRVLNY